MSGAHTVDEHGRYDGRTLTEAAPLVVDEIVAAFDPAEVILFGSVAHGGSGPDSDLDLLVVFDDLGPTDRRDLMRRVRGTITTFVPLDILIADTAELATDRDTVGSALYWALREGRSLYRRASVRAG